MAKALLVVVLLCAWVGSAAAQSIALNVVRPATGEVVNSELTVAVFVTSTYQIASVSAQVESKTMSLSSSGGAFTATIPLAGLARGNKTVLISAQDIYGATSSAQANFIYDQRPHVILELPVYESVARPTIRVRATCSDDDPAGCKQLQIAVGGVVVSGTSVVDQVISLAGHAGERLTVGASGRDSRDQDNDGFPQTNIEVEDSSHLTELQSVGGPIWDTDGARLFYTPATAGKGLSLHTIASNSDVTVAAAGGVHDGGEPHYMLSYNFLTPSGAVYVDHDGHLTEWRNGTTLDLAGSDFTLTVRKSGDFLLWANWTGVANRYILRRRELVNGTDVDAVSDAFAQDWDVASNGDVVFERIDSSGHFDLHRYRNGSITPLTAEGSATLRPQLPLSDGINVAYRRFTNTGYGIALVTAAGVQELAPVRALPPAVPYDDYQVNGGYTAFTRLDGTGRTQVWMRTPAGALAQVSFFGSDTKVDSLGPNGELFVRNGVRRYRIRSGQAPLDVSSSAGRVFWLGSQAHVVLGRTLFRLNDAITPVSDAGPGSLDGGTGVPDATTGHDVGGPRDAALADSHLSDGAAADARVADAALADAAQISDGAVIADAATAHDANGDAAAQHDANGDAAAQHDANGDAAAQHDAGTTGDRGLQLDSASAAGEVHLSGGCSVGESEGGAEPNALCWIALLLFGMRWLQRQRVNRRARWACRTAR